MTNPVEHDSMQCGLSADDSSYDERGVGGLIVRDVFIFATSIRVSNSHLNTNNIAMYSAIYSSVMLFLTYLGASLIWRVSTHHNISSVPD